MAGRWRLVVCWTVASMTLLGFSSTRASAQSVAAPEMTAEALRAQLAPTWAAPGRPMPKDVAELDLMVRQKDFSRLSDRLRTARSIDDVGTDVIWEQTQLFNGGGFVFAYAYMFDLWRVAPVAPPQDADRIKQSAATAFLYALDLIYLDGPKCADVSAPGHRRDQLLTQNQDLIKYLVSLPIQTRMALGSQSLDVERATASFRHDDPVLCSGGAAEMAERLKAQGDKPLPLAPNPPGVVGKTYAVPPAPGYTPEFVSEDVWAPKQATARRSMPSALTRLLTTPADAQPNADSTRSGTAK
jgi:hypothetical protein